MRSARPRCPRPTSSKPSGSPSGLERFRTEQPPYSILSRGIEREVLPVAQRYGMGILVWGPLGQGILTGRVRKGQQTTDVGTLDQAYLPPVLLNPSLRRRAPR